ncbi:hypothetical protein GOBAR_AA07627 [Gossypium barbadense]|uniref:Uncharacterized protein n=1 Tax=Gossypium barbadense TaxID=3634 RepID=A0A2P5YBS5_GOSBA|nr:hypothetical protein GOBAR_AA07627 [Gossypium barbadense]
MLTKFISVLETHFQNTETTFKNQQASIQGHETQIGQLTKLISERPQGSLSSNTESNPKEQINAITIQDVKGLVAPKPESKEKNCGNSYKNAYEPCSNNNKGPIYEERRLQIEELDEWRTQKLRIPNKLKLSQDEYFPYGTIEVIHPKFGTFKLIAGMMSGNSSHRLDYTEERCKPMYTGLGEANEARHSRKTRPCAPTHPSNTGVDRMSDTPKFKNRETYGQKLRHTGVSHGRVPQNLYKPLSIHHLSPQKSQTLAAVTLHALPPTPVQCRPHVVRRPLFPPQRSGNEQRHPQGLFFEIVELMYLEFTLELCSTFHLQTVMTNFDNPGMVQLRLGGLRDLVPASATYDPSHSKASALPPSLRYLHAILAYTLTGKRESTGVVTTHDATYPPQYRLAQANEEEDLKDITNDVPSCHEDPPTQPPPLHRPVHTAASYSNISGRLTRFEQ